MWWWSSNTTKTRTMTASKWQSISSQITHRRSSGNYSVSRPMSQRSKLKAIMKMQINKIMLIMQMQQIMKIKQTKKAVGMLNRMTSVFKSIVFLMKLMKKSQVMITMEAEETSKHCHHQLIGDLREQLVLWKTKDNAVLATPSLLLLPLKVHKRSSRESPQLVIIQSNNWLIVPQLHSMVTSDVVEVTWTNASNITNHTKLWLRLHIHMLQSRNLALTTQSKHPHSK